MKAEKRRHIYRLIAFLMALLLTVSDAGMIAQAKTEAANDVTVQGEETENIGEQNGTGDKDVIDKGTGDEDAGENGTGDEDTGDKESGNDSEPGNDDEETDPDPAEDEPGDEETDPADGETGDEGTDPVDGDTGDEETDPADGEPEDEESDLADGETEDEETDSAEDDETITDDGQLEIETLTMDISGNNLMLNNAVVSLGTPQNLVLDNGSTDIRLSWDMVSEATAEYEIQFAIDENLSPDKLTDNDFKTFITVDPDQAVKEPPDGLVWQPYVMVAGNRMTYTFHMKTLPVNPENPDYIAGYNYIPTLSQYAVYRVRAVVMDETAGTGETAESGGATADPTYGEFSNYASANGMLNYEKENINNERRKRFNMPGSGDYVRFFLGDAEGNEYNEKRPIILHVGESRDNLTLWAVCADGTKVNYTQMRDAVMDAEWAEWNGVADQFKVAGVIDNYYNFTWAIDEQLAGRDNIYRCCDECSNENRHIQPFYKYLGNPVADCLGFKALVKTNGTAYLGVSLNASHSISSYNNGVSFRFFVPIQILEAERDYPELDDESVICETSEEFWAAARQNIRDRKENFVVLMTEQACIDFCNENGYKYTIHNAEWGWSSEYLTLDLEDKDREYIIDRWLFTQYEEQEGMEPWAGDNLMIAFKKDSHSSVNNLRLNGQRYHGITFSAQYRTTLEQEQELDAKIAELLGEGGALHEAYVSGNQLKKIQAAYNYTKGIKWVDGRLDPLNYTVYSGVIRRMGSCESSSETFVRLCHEMGVNARVVKDDYWLVGGNKAHAWNIVEYKGLWYYVDCTSGIFMKGSSTFSSRQQLALYRSKEFKDSHPISKYDYVMRKVTYNLNGGTNAAMNPDSFEQGDVLTIAPPTKKGYTFEGWYADKAFKTQLIGPEADTYDTSSLAGNLTLHAKWRVNVYTLSYDMNIPQNTTVKKPAAISDVSVKYNAAVKIAANKNALYKYAFTGWNTAADGTGKAYKAGASVKNLASEDGAEYKLYAQWAPTTYTVKYDGNGSSVGLSVKGKTANTTMTFYEETNTTKANGFTISGYKFTGWNTRADGRGLKLGTEAGADGKVSGSAMIGTTLETAYARDTKATVTLYAQWEAIPYTVKLHRNDGTETDEPVTVMLDIGKALSSKSETNLTRNGYKLSSWNTKPDGRGKKYALTAKNLAKPGGTIELYAQWGKPLSYKVTYDLQGGKNPSKGKKNPTRYTVVSTEEQRTLVVPTRAGYTFVKWVDASAWDPENVTGMDGIEVIPVDVCRSIKLRAVWEENSYRVIYHGANEKYSSVTDDIEKIYKYTELADAFAVAKQYTLKDGLEDKVSISAWTTKAKGKGKSYAVGKGFSKLSAYDKDDASGKGTVHLYAKWSTAVYRISYVNCSRADGVKNSNAVSYTYNAKKTVSIKKPTRAGYVFAGWSVPDGKDYFDRAKNRIKAGTAEDVVLTANWTPITYEVKLKLNNKDKGISFKTDAKTIYGSRDGNGIAYNTETDSFNTQDIVNIPVYYNLVGWNTKTNGKGIAAKCETDAATGEITSVNLAGLCTKNKGTVTLYAIWKPKTYSITYMNVDPDSTEESISELDGVKVSNPATYTYSASRAVKLKNPTRYGFVFEGWYRNYDSATGVYTDKITSIPKGSYRDITLYGKWRVK